MRDIFYLAVDGGGTKTDAVCADSSGAVIGRGLAGPTNLTSTSVGAASFNLIEAIRQAVETLPEEEQAGFPILVMGLAGLDSQKEYEEAFKIFSRAIAHYKIDKFVLLNDSLIALENGTVNPNAVIVISGTGSICFGKNDQGETAKSSGMDYLLADQGSGYAIGRRVLREAVKSYDGRAPKSILEELVCKHFKIETVLDLKSEVYHPPLTKIEIAELAPLCTEALAQNDIVATDIFDRTIADIITNAMAVIRKLGLEKKQFDFVLSGTVSKIPYINDGICGVLADEYPLAKIIIPDGDPVFGGLKLAMKELKK
jgi:N-acetylglucosamine kinase-like BadF-type ATPase